MARGPGLVLFDLNDTLVDHTGTVRRTLLALRNEFPLLDGISTTSLTRRYNTLLAEAHPAIVRGELDAASARVARFARLLSEFGRTTPADTVARLAGRYREVYQASRRRLPGALGLLRSLSKSCTVGVLTNNRRSEQVETLTTFGLWPHVDFLITSEETGVPKPDPRAFKIAVRRADGSSATSLMVGDSWDDDVRGALRAGLRAVWLNRFGAPSPPPDPRVEVLESFVPVATTVRRMQHHLASRPPAARRT